GGRWSGGGDDIVDAALEDGELVGEHGGEVGRLAAGCRGGGRRERYRLAAEQVEGGARQAQQQAGNLADAIEHALGAHEVEDALFLHAPLELAGDGADVDAGGRDGHGAERGDGGIDGFALIVQ